MSKRTREQRRNIVAMKIVLKDVLALLFIPWTFVAIVSLFAFFLMFTVVNPNSPPDARDYVILLSAFAIPVFWVSTLRWYLRFNPYRIPRDAEPIIDEPPAAPDGLPQGSPAPPWLGPPVDPGRESFREGEPPTRRT